MRRRAIVWNLLVAVALAACTAERAGPRTDPVPSSSESAAVSGDGTDVWASAGALWVAGTVAAATDDRIEFVDGQVLQRTGPHLFRCKREVAANGPTLVCGNRADPLLPGERICSGGYRVPDGSMWGVKIFTGPDVACGAQGFHLAKAAN